MTEDVQAGVGGSGCARHLASGTGAADTGDRAENSAVDGGATHSAPGAAPEPSAPVAAPKWPDCTDAERELALVGGDVTALLRRAESAHAAAWQRAWNGPGSQVLGYELQRVKRQVADWMAHKPPNPIEAAMVLLAAERRWNAIQAASWHPLAAMAAAMAGIVQPAAAPPIIARLAARGITLALSEAGQIVAMPAGMLNETDRAQLTRHKADIVRALQSAETVA